MQTLINVILGFVNSFYGTIFKWIIDRIRDYWKFAGTWVVGMVMTPLAYFILGPFFKITSYVFEKIFNLILAEFPDNGPVIQITGLAAWVIECFRIQECLSVIMSFMALSLLISILKKVF